MNFLCDVALQLISSSYEVHSDVHICKIIELKCIPDYPCILGPRRQQVSGIFWQLQFCVVDYEGGLCCCFRASEWRGNPKLILSWSWSWTWSPVPTPVHIPPSVSVNPLLHPQADPNAGLDVFLIDYGFIFKLNPLSGAFSGESFIVRLDVCTCVFVRGPASLFNLSKACRSTLMKWWRKRTNTRWISKWRPSCSEPKILLFTTALYYFDSEPTN